MMTASDRAKSLVKKFEGLVTKAYLCPAGVITIGYGHTATLDGRKLTINDSVTQAQADALLDSDLSNFSASLLHALDASEIVVNQNQFDALVSFAFNVGVHALVTSTLWKKMEQGDMEGAAKQFDRWVYAGGTKLQGLITRRKAERDLFETPIDG